MSNLAHRKTIKAATGIVFRLKEYDTILNVTVADGSVTVLVESLTVLVRGIRSRVTAKLIKLFSLVPTADGWVTQPPFIAPSPDFEPYLIHHRGKTSAEAQASADWADLAYRAGSGRAPMDSSTRIEQNIQDGFAIAKGQS